jgi:hypothetical protein
LLIIVFSRRVPHTGGAAPRPPPPPPHAAVSRARRLLGAVPLALWLGASALSALLVFSRSPAIERAAGDLESLYAPLRAANVYHLFGHITRERIEPQFQTRNGGNWTEHDLRYKPGNVYRRPPYVAPHQPRVDFRLWFLFGALRGRGIGGMGFAPGVPRYIASILEHLCRAPAEVQPLFAQPLPHAPDAVRIAFYRYHFASREAHAQDGAYFERELLGTTPQRSCR